MTRPEGLDYHRWFASEGGVPVDVPEDVPIVEAQLARLERGA